MENRDVNLYDIFIKYHIAILWNYFKARKLKKNKIFMLIYVIWYCNESKWKLEVSNIKN